MELILENLGAAIALSGVLITAVLSFWASRRNAYLSIIVVERAKWINELRNSFSELLALLSSMHVVKIQKLNVGEDRPTPQREDIHQIELMINKILLQLNRDENDAVLVRLHKNLNKLPSLAEGGSVDTYRQIEKEVVNDARFLLNDEWSKIDIEVRGDFFSLISARIWKRDQVVANYYKKIT